MSILYTNLHKRRITDSAICPLCQQIEETVQHAVSGCVLATEVWQSIQLHTKWDDNVHTGMKDWLMQVTENMEQRCFELGLVVMWAIWSS